jgi:hypothetical protein
MVRKIIQWVPIDGTRWRNGFVNGHEDYVVGVHYGVAYGGDMASRRELSNTARGGPCFILHQTRNGDSLGRRHPTVAASCC